MYLQVDILDVNASSSKLVCLTVMKKARSCTELWAFLYFSGIKTLQTALREESENSCWLKWIHLPLAVVLHNVYN